MERSINRAVDQYKSIGGKDEMAKKGRFYASDIYQVMDMCRKNGGRIDAFEAIGIALQAGFAIGYRTAKRHCAANR